MHGIGLDGVGRHFYVRQPWDGKGEAFERAIGEFAEGYADQNEDDYRRLRVAEDSSPRST